MPRPGANIAFGDATPAAGAPTDISQYFIAGQTEKGAIGTAYKVSSMPAFDSKLGGRLATSVVRDAVETALREGASAVYVSRVAGPQASAASLTLPGDDSGTPVDSIIVSAKSPGAWGNDLNVAVLAGSAFKIQVTDADGAVLETSPDLVDLDAAVAWGKVATYVTVTKVGTVAPTIAAAAPLVGGDDDADGITSAEKIAALDAFSSTLGPGQVNLPGETDATVLSAVLAHCPANNRVALIDVPDSDVLADMTAVPAALRDDLNASYGAAFGPWVSIPGTIPGTTRRVPYGAVEAGICARSDRTFNAGRACAGDEFPLHYVVGFTDFTDAEHETALLAGLNLAKDVYGVPQTYGFRSLVDPATDPDWVQFNYARLRMAISARLNAVAQGFVFDQIDGAGHKLQELKDALTAVLSDFYIQGALYGATAADAFRVDVSYGDGLVNTPESVQAGELRARVAVIFSPHAEVVYIDVAKLPLTQRV